MPLRVTDVESTDLFVGTEAEPRQVLRVRVAGAPDGDVRVTVTGEGLSAAPADVAGPEATVEVGVRTDHPVGTHVPVSVEARRGDETAHAESTLVVEEPGWTMHMVSHFHYDPVWWNTQAAYTSEWDALDWPESPRADFQHTGFDLVRAHLALAERDPDYRFVLAEIDYLKPYWDFYPEDRALVRRLLDEGRLELLGGTYNEANTNLTHAETTARNAVYGVGWQRDVMGGDPATAWQLDSFGHDPQFPGLMADAGLTSSSWARGPFHQWGPMLASPHDRVAGDATVMQFRSEFEWLSPSGRGVLTSYMPNHYSAGWWMDDSPTLDEALAQTYRLFSGLKPVAATRNVLLPVGTDYSPPNKWVTDVHRAWNARYVWPRFACALPRDFFDAVRAELDARGVAPSPQTRDMNPVYTGKDVSYIDTKQAQREAETALLDAEKAATLACLLGEAAYPDAALDKAWRQLVFGAHHDGITGSESDQVYLDLVTGWREALELGTEVRDTSLAHLTAHVDTSGRGRALVVHNTASFVRTDLVRVDVTVDEPGVRGLRVLDGDGREVPVLVEHPTHGPDGTLRAATLSLLARDVPGVGYRTYRLVASDAPAPGATWSPAGGTTVENGSLRAEVDPARGGCVRSLVETATGREVLAAGRVGNELLVYDEYPEHPEFHEGPWHLVPSGAVAGSSSCPADDVRVETCALGQRVTVTGSVGPVTYTQVLTLWSGLDRLDCVTHVDEFSGSDHLVRVRWPCDLPGALPVSEVADAVVGRGFGLPDVDSAEAPWTLDNPAYGWFGLSSTARVVLRDGDGTVTARRALGVAEVVVGREEDTGPLGRDLAVALVRAGVTSTTSVATGSRYGSLDVDSNLPDVRVAVGGPGENAFTAAALAEADPAYAAALDRQLAETGRARVWVPADRPLTDVWVPNADLRGPRTLPVLVVAGVDANATRAALADLADDLEDATVQVDGALTPGGAEPFTDYTVAVLNRGLPGFAVDPTGALHLSLMRSCTGWPSGVWIDPPRRTAPDGSGFQLQHWTHSFEYALTAASGDWREAGVVAHGHAYNHPLRAVVTEASAGPLPPSTTLLSVEPSPAVVLTTLKPAGNPLARGSGEVADPRRGVTLRWYETAGSPAEVRVTSPYAPLSSGARADLLETPGDAVKSDDGALVTPVEGCEITTLVATPDVGPGPTEAAPLGPAREPAQPVYTRYWLHNKGPAPLGYQPVSVHVHPATLTVEGPATLRVTVASDLVDASAPGRVRLAAPDGWTVDPPERLFTLAPEHHGEFEATLTPPPDPEPGTYVLAASLDQGAQTFEDVVTLHVPGRDGDADLPLLDVVADLEGVTAVPGERVTLTARARNRARSEIRGEAQVVSPYGTWAFLGPWSQPFAVAPGDETEITVAVDVPLSTRPGTWWALLKLMWFGRVVYGPAVPVRVEAPR